MKILNTLLAFGLFVSAAPAYASSFTCIDGLSAQYSVKINNNRTQATVTPQGENQGSKITDVAVRPMVNPDVIEINFKENGMAIALAIGTDGVSTIQIQGQRMHSVDCRQD
jgi:hypothetical protein